MISLRSTRRGRDERERCGQVNCLRELLGNPRVEAAAIRLRHRRDGFLIGDSPVWFDAHVKVLNHGYGYGKANDVPVVGCLHGSGEDVMS